MGLMGCGGVIQETFFSSWIDLVWEYHLPTGGGNMFEFWE